MLTKPKKDDEGLMKGDEGLAKGDEGLTKGDEVLPKPKKGDERFNEGLPKDAKG